MKCPEKMTVCCEIPYDYLDFRGFCRPAAFFYFTQRAAVEHARGSVYSREELERQGAFFMLSRQRLFVSRPVRQEERLIVSTWLSSTAGAGWTREFTVQSGEETVARVCSWWVTVDLATRRILPPSAFGDREIPTIGAPLCRLRPLPAVPEEGACFLKTVSYGDLDQNVHLNNVRAAEILCDAAGLHRKADRFVSEFQINFLAETRPDELLSVHTRADDGGDLLHATAYGEGKARFSGEICLSPLPETANL